MDEEFLNEVNQYKKLEQEFSADFHTSSDLHYFLISTKLLLKKYSNLFRWLQAWKELVGYDGNPPKRDVILP